MGVPEVFKDGNLNAEWIKHVDRKDSLMSKIRAFYLPGPSIKPAVQCGERNCKWLVRSAEYLNPVSTKFEYNPMVFCFTCNQTYHVQCVGLEKDTLSEEAVPWLCLECRKNVLNDSAKAYFSSSKYTQTMAIRRKHFLRETVKEDADKEYDTDSEFDAQDIVAFERMKTSEMQADAKKNAEKNEAQEAIAECSMLKAEVKRLQETIAKLQVGNHPADLSTVINESLSAFYTQNNLMLPASESTRWKVGASSNSEAGQPTIQLNGDASSTDQAETSVVEVLSRFTNTQERIENEKRLASIRRLSTICEFNGDPLKWLEFEQDVIRYKRVCKYDDDMVKIRLRSALKGNAFNAVKDVFDIFSLDEIINILREAFGDPLTMVKHKAKEIKALKVPAVMYREDAVIIRVTLQGYFAACTYAKTGCINSNELAENIYQQFSPEDKSRCKEMFIRKYPGKPIIVCLNTIYDFLGERLLVLDVKSEDVRDRSIKSEKKSFQVNAVGATTSSSGIDKNGFKFEVRDKSSAPYMGYDMAKVCAISEKCTICDQNHFTVQCNQYKTMSEEQRVKMINEKQLCKNCVITSSHRGSECPLKISCGLKLGRNGRCAKKHHATIHYACTKYSSGDDSNKQQYRRSNTRYNTTVAQQKIEQASQMADAEINTASSSNVQQQVATAIQTAVGVAKNVNTHLTADAPVFHTQSPRNYTLNPYPNFTGVLQINQAQVNQIPRTVKMFKNKFHGPNGYVVAYSVGDSGAEATLVRNDLRIALGLEGKAETLCLQWTNNTVKEYVAIKFDLEIQGILPHSRRIILKDCYAIDDFDLPARSLDMSRMRSRFPYLKDVQFDSYFNEQPVILVGSPHAFAIENIKGLIEGGEGLPVALETKLGVTVYGGNPADVEISNVNINFCADKTDVKLDPAGAKYEDNSYLKKSDCSLQLQPDAEQPTKHNSGVDNNYHLLSLDSSIVPLIRHNDSNTRDLYSTADQLICPLPPSENRFIPVLLMRYHEIVDHFEFYISRISHYVYSSPLLTSFVYHMFCSIMNSGRLSRSQILRHERKRQVAKDPTRGRVHIIQLDGVDPQKALSSVVDEFIIECNSIIGCHRVADYAAEILDSVVFLYLTSEREYRELLEQHQVIIDGRIVTFSNPNLMFGTAKYTTAFSVSTDEDIRGTPMPIGLFGFRSLPVMSTFYIIAVLQLLEARYTGVTGFRLAYCEMREMTRNFGFATFLTRSMALQLHGQVYSLHRDRIEAKIPNGTPVLIHECSKFLLQEGRCDLTQEIARANWLNVNITDPTRPMRPTIYPTPALTHQSVAPQEAVIPALPARTQPQKRISPIRFDENPQPNISKQIDVVRNWLKAPPVIRRKTPPASPSPEASLKSLSPGRDMTEQGERKLPDKRAV